ncbi:hypothetical protein GEMRC1_001869 [Eukaryota sp. GEM-RC1]
MSIYQHLSPPFIRDFSASFISLYYNSSDALSHYTHRLTSFERQCLKPLISALLDHLQPPDVSLSYDSSYSLLFHHNPVLTSVQRSQISSTISSHLSHYHPIIDSNSSEPHQPFFPPPVISSLTCLVYLLLQQSPDYPPFSDNDNELKLVGKVSSLLSSLTEAHQEITALKQDQLTLQHQLSLQTQELSLYKSTTPEALSPMSTPSLNTPGLPPSGPPAKGNPTPDLLNL